MSSYVESYDLADFALFFTLLFFDLNSFFNESDYFLSLRLLLLCVLFLLAEELLIILGYSYLSRDDLLRLCLLGELDFKSEKLSWNPDIDLLVEFNNDSFLYNPFIFSPFIF